MKLKCLVFTGVCTAMLGCGYIDNDRLEDQINVVGNIKVNKQENSTQCNLVYKETNEIFSIIIENCKSVYYDSISKSVFAEGPINNDKSNYYQIIILNPNGINLSGAIRRETIAKAEFFERTRQLKSRLIFSK